MTRDGKEGEAWGMLTGWGMFFLGVARIRKRRSHKKTSPISSKEGRFGRKKGVGQEVKRSLFFDTAMRKEGREA